MIEYIALIVALVLVVVMSTVGGVLLVKFWAGKFSRSVRILLSMIAGSASLLVPAMVAVLSEDLIDEEVITVLIAFFVLPLIVIGWPTAFLATRKLDKLTEIKASVFE